MLTQIKFVNSNSWLQTPHSFRQNLPQPDSLVSTAALLKSLSFSFNQLLTDFLESALEILRVFGHGSFALPASSAVTIRIGVGVRVRVSALLVETLPRDQLEKILFSRKVFFDFEVLRYYVSCLSNLSSNYFDIHCLRSLYWVPPAVFYLVGSHQCQKPHGSPQASLGYLQK